MKKIYTQLSEHFTLREMYASATADKLGINNTPNAEQTANLRKLAEQILEPIRKEYGHPIKVNSGFRCAKLNTAVKGAKTSQHLTGEAADISCVSTDKATLFHLIRTMMATGKIKVGQLIWEYGTLKEPNWIHVSLPRTNGKPNNQILYLYSK